MNASKVGLKIDFKKAKNLHAGHNSKPSPVTTINGYTLEICNDFLYLGVSTKTPLNVVRKKFVEHGLQSANSDLFSFPKSMMLTRCAFLKPRSKQLQHMGWIQSPFRVRYVGKSTRPIVKWSGMPWALPGQKIYRLWNLLLRPS